MKRRWSRASTRPSGIDAQTLKQVDDDRRVSLAMATAAELVREPRRTDRMIDPGRWSAGENAVGTLFARIARVLAGTYPDDPDVLLRPVFVVVDDIDAHLHPATQTADSYRS